MKLVRAFASQEVTVSTAPVQQDWHPTACILCSLNCGLAVQTEGERITRVRGDERHPRSEGYLCQKASRLDYYQNHADRLDAPLRRRPDGSFERISWETAIREIAGKLVAIREAHGGRALAYYGGPPGRREAARARGRRPRGLRVLPGPHRGPGRFEGFAAAGSRDPAARLWSGASG
jgi:anaerobic selenocysteine-containing dehydrogenase